MCEAVYSVRRSAAVPMPLFVCQHISKRHFTLLLPHSNLMLDKYGNIYNENERIGKMNKDGIIIFNYGSCCRL